MRSKVKSFGRSMDTPSSPTKVSRKREAKALGTRVGTLRDWRLASGKPAKDSGRRRETMRDGR